MINPEVMGAQQNETFRRWYGIQIRYTTTEHLNGI